MLAAQLPSVPAALSADCCQGQFSCNTSTPASQITQDASWELSHLQILEATRLRLVHRIEKSSSPTTANSPFGAIYLQPVWLGCHPKPWPCADSLPDLAVRSWLLSSECHFKEPDATQGKGTKEQSIVKGAWWCAEGSFHFTWKDGEVFHSYSASFWGTPQGTSATRVVAVLWLRFWQILCLSSLQSRSSSWLADMTVLPISTSNPLTWGHWKWPRVKAYNWRLPCWNPNPLWYFVPSPVRAWQLQCSQALFLILHGDCDGSVEWSKPSSLPFPDTHCPEYSLSRVLWTQQPGDRPLFGGA